MGMILSTINETTGYTVEQMPAERYHADEAIGSTMLEVFRESRRLYEARYIKKTIPAKEPSAVMERGTLIHLRLLEPERFSAETALIPSDAPQRRSKVDKEWWASFEETNKDKHLITADDLACINGAAESVLSKRWASKLLRGDGQPEFSIFWNDKETGLRLKVRVDWFALPVSTDLKTTGDAAPAKFVRRCVDLGYHRKHAHYLAGIQAYTGDKDPLMVNVAVSTSPPFSSGAYNINDFDSRMNARLGVMERRNVLRDLAKCYDTGDWSDTWENEIMELAYPAYAFTQSAYH